MLSGAELKQLIIAYSQRLGIDQIGFAGVADLLHQDARYEQYQMLGFSTGFEESELRKRCDITLSLPGAQTCIAVAMAYPHQGQEVVDSPYTGRFCRASWGQDYHQVLTDKLQQLAEYCQTLVDHLTYEILVDTGSLSDRGAAVCCGLGWIGRNSHLITRTHGSFVYLGELLLDMALPTDRPQPDGCGHCRRCQEACPLGAIDGTRRMVDGRKCLAYGTLDKHFPTPLMAQAIAREGYIYGCDLCQLACPHNHWPDPHHEAFLSAAGEQAPDLRDLLKLSNKTFRAQYGHLSGSWRGKRVLQRNALLILGARELPECRPLYESLLADDQADIRKAAQWALDHYETTLR